LANGFEVEPPKCDSSSLGGNAAIAACGGAWLHALQLLNKLGANADQVTLGRKTCEQWGIS